MCSSVSMSSVLVQCRGDGRLSVAGDLEAGDDTAALLADLFGADALEDALGAREAGPDESDSAAIERLEPWDPDGLLTVWPDDHDAAERAVLEADPPSWFGLPAGPELATALADVHIGSASPTELIELMTSAQRLQAWVEALRVCAMAAFYRRRADEATAVADRSPGRVVDEPREVGEVTGRPVRDPMRSAAAEVAAALRLAPSTVTDHLDVAVRLCDTFPETVRELRAGRLTFSKALTIAQSTALLDVDRQRLVQERVLLTAGSQTPGQLRAACRRTVAAADPRNLAQRHVEARRERTVTKVPLPDGMAGLWFTHSADRIEECWVAIQALADLAKASGTPGTDSVSEAGAGTAAAAQRRADALADCLQGFLNNGADWLGRTFPAEQRRRPHIEVLVPVGTLLGLDDTPAELAGYGPIPASVARRIANDGRWRRILTDPATGTAVEAATRRHDPPAQVSETLIVRDQTCRWPGCRRPARRSQRDHVRKHRLHGVTQLDGMAMFCDAHHDLKDFGSWVVTAEPGGVLRFQAPTGHVYRTEPPRLYPSDLSPPQDDPSGRQPSDSAYEDDPPF